MAVALLLEPRALFQNVGFLLGGGRGAGGDIRRAGLEIAVKRGADGVQSGREGGPGF